MYWLNEPPYWQQTEDGLSLVTADHTDFWRHTHYGFVRDSGHAYLKPVDADFSAEVFVRADYAALYDQGGLLLRLSETHWIKAGVEFVGGQAHLSAVVTRDRSDWSVRPCPAAVHGVRLRLTRRADAVLIETALPGEGWQLLRLTDFPTGPAAIGPMACTPERAGLRARFAEFRITSPVGELHQVST